MSDPKTYVNALIAIMKSAAPIELRAAAAQGLGLSGHEDAREALLVVAKGSAPIALRAAAAKALGQSLRNA